MPRPKDTKKPGLRYLNEAQLKSFKGSLERYGTKRDRVMMNLTLFLGLRAQELVNIKVSDIETDSQQITIKGLKGGRVRSYSGIDENLWKRLSTYLRQSKVKDHVFPITTQAAKNVFKKYARLAGISADFSIHSFRHSCAILKARKGDSPIKIMLWLRHRSIASTQRYFEQVLFENEAEQMNDLLEDYL